MPAQRIRRNHAPYIRLKELLAARELYVADLSLAVGLSRPAIYRSLSKHSGLEHYWMEIAEWLKISLDWLIAGKPSAAPIEFIDVTAAAAFSDTEVIISGRVIGSGGHKPTECWPIKTEKTYVASRGRWAVQMEDKICLELNAGVILALDIPMDEHLGDSRSIVSNGDLVVVQVKDGTVNVGKVQKESKRGWYVITGEKTTVLTDDDIHRMHIITSIDLIARVENAEKKQDEQSN